MTCIYCKRDGPATGQEHVYPEALGTHDWKLPVGAVCDDCNGGTLRKLDLAVTAHPHIGPLLFMHGVPGKNGPRQRLGHFETGKDGEIRIRPPASYTAEVQVDKAAGRVFVRFDPPAEFRPDLFCRGLFKIGLNVVAAEDGVERALGEEYDAVRNYVKRPPSRHTFFPYAQRTLRDTELPDEAPVVQISRVSIRRFETVRLAILRDEFLLDLLDPTQAFELIANHWPEESDVVLHRSDGKPYRLDGREAQPLTFDNPGHPWADLLRRR